MKRKMEKFIFGSISISFPLLLTQKKNVFSPTRRQFASIWVFYSLKACTNKCSGYVLLSLSHVTGIKTKKLVIVSFLFTERENCTKEAPRLWKCESSAAIWLNQVLPVKKIKGKRDWREQGVIVVTSTLTWGIELPVAAWHFGNSFLVCRPCC